MSAAPSTRAALDDDTTHVLHFGYWCGASRLDRIRGLGLWILMTADDYAKGYEHNESGDWDLDSRKGTPVRDLAAWVSARVGYPVKLIRADELIDPDWAALVAYRVERARTTV